MIMSLRALLYLSVALLNLLFSDTTRAMAILDFGKMNLDDESTYVASLVAGTAKLLKAQGKSIQAQKAIDLFKDSSKEGGVNQFILNLKALNAQNDRNATNAKNMVPIYEVEDAMQLTLKDHGIDVPVRDLLTINQNFTPIGPPRPRTGGQ
jgi:hypothetical protein